MLLIKSLMGSALAMASTVVATAANHDQVTLEKDVIIIGGGASGSHAAVRLREDFGKTIVVIEKEATLGGHVNTYSAPSGNYYDFGVQVFLDIEGAADFFARLGVQTKEPSRTPITNRYVDFTTGNRVNYTDPASEDITAALEKYAKICAQYEDLLVPGYWNFPTPNDIPEDLLLPFGDFAKKYEIEAVVPSIFTVTGLGDTSKALTIWVMQAFGGDMARSYLGELKTLVLASGRNQELYDAIADLLADDVLYSSRVIKSKRSTEGVTITVENASGKHTLIKAKRLLLAIEPTPSNLAPFDFDHREIEVFNKYSYMNLYVGIVANSALPKGESLVNLPATAAPNNYLAFPQPSFTTYFNWAGTETTDIFRHIVVGNETLSARRAKKLVQDDFDRIIKAGTLENPKSTKLEFVDFAVHGPIYPWASADELRAGFIQVLYALQSLRSTWWTGGAWSVRLQTHLWLYNDVLLPKLIDGLESGKTSV
ncbi:hypothetical protein B0J13DRAFT_459905 [Dactylonectria estremocensis]|uniref:Amine oxidase domain-containing protein n=1 Tax=Dactylonectria estremocensis TaxID=1079267 RepID=A0A9P9D9M5_9HYPO|nr:hypothetical protein B0J13DRAFT_459905 [Dactylonectria estremocensis]